MHLNCRSLILTRTRHPRSPVLTVRSSGERVRQHGALAGANGYVDKQAAGSTLIPKLREIWDT